MPTTDHSWTLLLPIAASLSLKELQSSSSSKYKRDYGVAVEIEAGIRMAVELRVSVEARAGIEVGAHQPERKPALTKHETEVKLPKKGGNHRTNLITMIPDIMTIVTATTIIIPNLESLGVIMIVGHVHLEVIQTSASPGAADHLLGLQTLSITADPCLQKRE